jgi:indolepyruvate ferredoxin oxidoreductase alpha subunit
VGTNVASDALANLASGGVTGGALIIVGEDYGEGSSIMQERSHAFAMKSQIWLLDPPQPAGIVQAVKDGFELSEASNTPVMLQLRIRACHVHGSSSPTTPPAFTLKEALEIRARRQTASCCRRPASCTSGKDRAALARRGEVHRGAPAQRILRRRATDDIGIIVQGGSYNTPLRALQQLGLADVYGDTACRCT